MAQPGYIFGKGTPDTYESLQAKRKTAERLQVAASRAPQNVGEGLTSLGQAIAYRRLMNQADTGDAAGRAAYDDKRQSILGMLMGGQMGGMGGGGAMPPSGPATPSAFATPNPAGLPPEIINAVDRVDSPIPEQFGKIESTYGLPAGYLDRTYMIESGGNPNAQNPNSSAGGGFQFIDSTAAQYGLTDKTDLAASADAAARLAADNAKALRAGLGREPTAAELYLAHQQGAGGALKLLTNPNAPASSLVGGDAVALNGGDPSMTGGAFASLWTNKFGGAPAASGGSAMSTPGAAIPGLTELLSDPYATEADKMVLGMLLEQQMTAMQPADPMQALEMKYKEAQIAQMQNGGSEADLPAGYRELELRALDAGLVKGSPEYQQFMLTGGGGIGEDTPAAFQALKLQAIDAGLVPGSDEYKQFMLTKGAGDAALAKGQGTALAEDVALLDNLKSKLPGLKQVVTELENLADDATYTGTGQAVDWTMKQFGLPPRDSAVARTKYTAMVDNQVLPMLRDTFGAQFTVAEGETLRSTLGDPDKSPSEKKAVLRAFIEQKVRNIQALEQRVAPTGAPDTANMSDEDFLRWIEGQ